MANDHKLTGVFPIAPTPFDANGDLDLESQRRVIDCMVDQGVDGICILANYSEQFALSDGERDTLLDVCLEQTNARVPVIATCSHYSSAVAIERSLRAKRAGASMLMMMPPYHGALIRASEEKIVEHFRALSDAVGLPIMVQDAPLSGANLSVSLLARMAREIPQVRYLKIETPQTAAKLAALIAAAGDDIDGPFDGEESITLLADLDAGATGTMPSAMLPDLIRPVVTAFLSGHREEAMSEYNRILPLINFENRQCGLRATKAVMLAGGVITDDTVRHPQDPLPDLARQGLLELARKFDPVALRWGR